MQQLKHMRQNNQFGDEILYHFYVFHFLKFLIIGTQTGNQNRINQELNLLSTYHVTDIMLSAVKNKKKCKIGILSQIGRNFRKKIGFMYMKK